jgi:hypothetical protein
MKKSAKPAKTRKPKPDFSQRALAAVEKITDGKLSDGTRTVSK